MATSLVIPEEGLPQWVIYGAGKVNVPAGAPDELITYVSGAVSPADLQMLQVIGVVAPAAGAPTSGITPEFETDVRMALEYIADGVYTLLGGQ